MDIQIKIADQVIDLFGLTFIQNKYFDGYIAQPNSIPTSKIYIYKSQLEQEEQKSHVRTVIKNVTSIISASPTQCELNIIYRKICGIMLQHDTILIHGAVIAINGQSYMFTAPSGTGKTTHIKKWLANLPESFVVNGDKPLIKAGNRQPMACGTPWAGKENMQTNTIVPLAAIVLMERSDNNEIEQISFSDAFPFLLKQTYRPKDTQKFVKTMQLLKSLDHRMRFYRFKFNNMKDDAFSVSYNALCNQ